ncbi:hypothetical protein FNV58_00860 (plasmid) [Streptomyces sp. RLB1-9]|uniref:hypothetical protein n=1 Tax=Streptomyces sp. RLB1-9 TaxID=2594454 RepID=UPI00116460CF|nr:hypothetical protein [Streptomyces sp. RLB1-9]QDN94910.1 hypothetical protein FNV58_00860 [Streptomyces sp. RLB1-9]
MPAASTTRPQGGRRTSDPDPFNVDMTEVPMTPAMIALHEVGKLRARILEVDHYLEELVLDGTELTLAEGQTATHTMRAQGRGFKWRMQLNRLLKGKRGIDPAKLNWRHRTRDLEPEEVPAYMSEEVLAAMRDLVEPLYAMIQDPSEQREELYPAIHERTKPAIEGHTIQAKAS